MDDPELLNLVEKYYPKMQEIEKQKFSIKSNFLKELSKKEKELVFKLEEIRKLKRICENWDVCFFFNEEENDQENVQKEKNAKEKEGNNAQEKEEKAQEKEGNNAQEKEENAQEKEKKLQEEENAQQKEENFQEKKVPSFLDKKRHRTNKKSFN